MSLTEFKATAVSSEINLNKIAQHFGIIRKFKWEEALTLQQQHLKEIIYNPEYKSIYIFFFGSIVFINFQTPEIMAALNYLKGIEKSINTANPLEYTDEYQLEIDAASGLNITNDRMTLPENENYHQEIVATVLAKSVALEKIEIDIDLLLDEIEDVVEYLHQGKLSVSNNQLSKMSARVLGFKFNTISYIMLLDKPDITWSNEEAGKIFTDLSILFELTDRYEKIRHKSETLMDITTVFTGLVHAQRGTRLELAIITLIAIEIGLYVFEMFFH